ncbi:MAG TPA: FecR domain-containing protein [Edaphobacter sp.]
MADLPLESGFNLVTGADGRAEIEFEDASTVYLAENSALAFNELSTTGGVPYTALGLLTGTATLHLHLRTPGETFVLRTPTDEISRDYPSRTYVRVSSYLNAVSMTMLYHSALPPSGAITNPPVQGLTAIYSSTVRTASEKPGNSNPFADWDNWVEDRITSRSAAMTAVMKASGLTSPLPGLADMNGQGTFFPCAPYGTCWQPADRPASQSDGAWHNAPRSSAPALQLATFTPQVVTPWPIEHFERDAFFPCPPTTIRSLIARDPVTGQESVLSSSMDPAFAPYDWAVCHAGSWVYRRNRYAWVVGNKRHPRCPVRWIKTGRSLAYVPIHPRDEKGKPPINRVHGVFAIRDKQGQSVERISLDAGSKIKLLQAPKEFRGLSSPPLSRAGDPHVDAHRLGSTLVASKDSGIREPGTRLTFDHKSQSFLVAKQVMLENKNAPELRAFNSRIGNVQTHAGSGRGFSGGGGSHGSGFHGAGGGGSHSGGGGGGSHVGGGGGGGGGGGSHIGGGGGGGGGGSHGGGGGASSGGGHH